MRFLLLAPVLAVSTLGFPQTQSDSQTLKALLEEVRLLRQDLHTTTVAAQRVQIALYRLQLQDAAVARAATLVEETRLKLTGLQDAHRHFVTEIEQSEHQRDQTQDFQERRQIEEDRIPRAKTTLQQISHDEEQQRAKLNEAEGQLKSAQIKLDGLHSLLDQLDQALENVGHARASASPR
jgi:DNA repair exonuclease SbcCD ATPase subunit